MRNWNQQGEHAAYVPMEGDDEEDAVSDDVFSYMSSAQTHSAPHSAYHVYSDDRDNSCEMSLTMPSEELARPPWLTQLRHLPRRSKLAMAGSVAAFLFVATVVIRSSSPWDKDATERLEPADAVHPASRLSDPATVMHVSVSPRVHRSTSLATPEPAAEATATLVHFPESGAVEFEVQNHMTTTQVAGGVAQVATPRPGSDAGHLMVCTSLARVPGAEELVALLSSVRGGLVPWVHQVGHAVAAKTAHVECAGDLWHVRSHGEDALVCAKEDRVLALYTEHLAVTVLSHAEKQHGSPLPALECAAAEAPEVEPVDKESMWAGVKEEVQTWFQDTATEDVTAPTWHEGDDMEPLEPTGNNTGKNSTKKLCVFIHGVGQTPVPGSAPIVTGKFPNYWGNVEQYTEQCRDWVFLNVDTVMRGWDDRSLQKQVCAAATYDPVTHQSEVGPIAHRIVFTHSMGNLMLAGALEEGLCALDRHTSSWYEVSGPMKGSKMAAVVADMCKETGLYKYAAAKLGFCTAENMVAPAYRTLEPDYPGLAELAATIAPRIHGAMCGTSAHGLASMYSAEMLAVEELAGFEDLNDGVVPWSSCSVKGSVQFKPDYQSDWYAAAINHIDAECVNGDGSWGADRKPCSWYALRR